MNKLNIGIIGAGRIGKIHAHNLIAHPGVKVKAISDLQIHSLTEWAKDLGIPRITADNNEVISDEGIDAIFICSTTDTHIELINKAVAAGKHIFCEKPVSFDIAATRKTIDEIDKAGIKFQVGFNRRFDANFSRVRESLESGIVGEPHIIKITSRDPEPPPYEYIKRSGGMFIDMSIHDFDMARYLSGSEVTEVFVQGAVLVDPMIGKLGDIDTALITLRFANGALGVIDNSMKAVYGYDQRIEVFGSQGNIAAGNDYPNTVQWSTDNGVFTDKPKYFFLERYEKSYKVEIEAFIHSIQSGTNTQVGVNDAYQAELIAFAAGKSLLEGRPVKLQDVAAMITEEI